MLRSHVFADALIVLLLSLTLSGAVGAAPPPDDAVQVEVVGAELSVGKHRIEVSLADNDHQPLGPSQVLEVVIRPTVARGE